VDEDFEKRLERKMCRGELVLFWRRSTRSYSDQGGLGMISPDEKDEWVKYGEEVRRKGGSGGGGYMIWGWS